MVPSRRIGGCCPCQKGQGCQAVHRRAFPCSGSTLHRHHAHSPSQQISAKAAATIHGRLVALMPRGVTPKALLALTDEQLRGAGLSRQKTAYLRDLADKVRSGALPVHDLHALTDEEVIDAIVKV